MEKILVPTDFSNNSKAALRFAIRLAARQKGQHLVFINIHHFKRPFTDNPVPDDKFEAEKHEELNKVQSKLESFVKRIYQSLRIEPGDYSCEVLEGLKADVTLIDYCNSHSEIKLVTMSTRGASFLNKVLGTNTGNLITKSKVPVIAIPKDYIYKPLRNVLYASDLEHLHSEFQTVLDFAKPKGLTVELLHFSTPSSKDLEENLDRNALEEKAGYPLSIKIEKNDINHSMSRNLQDQLHKIKPSMLVLFTNQDRKLFEKIFLSSMAESLSFKIQTPLLVFKKA